MMICGKRAYEGGGGGGGDGGGLLRGGGGGGIYSLDFGPALSCLRWRPSVRRSQRSSTGRPTHLTE